MKISVSIDSETIQGEFTMSLTDIPARASRQIAMDDTEYDDTPQAMPRSAIHHRPIHTTDELEQQPIETSNRIGGKARLGLVVLLLLCVCFLLSGINAPFLAGNVVTIHIPIVWVVGIVAISIVALSLWHSQ